MVRPHPVLWLRSHPRAADGLLAALVATISVVFHLTVHDTGVADPSVWGVLITLLATVPIAWRRVAPVATLVTVGVAQMLAEVLNIDGAGWMGVLIAAYSLGAYRGGRAFWRLGGVMLAAVTVFVIIGVAHGDAPWQAAVSTPVVFASSLVLGDNMRRRRERAAELVEHAERAELERALLAQQHGRDERARIARELHDVVAHSVSLMVIQASAARRQLAVDPARADAALATVEQTGRSAMTEMRRILGVLRDEHGDQLLAPQPSLAALDALVASSSDLPVAMSSEGDLADLPTGVELSAYRIVQEALTNVRRHAGPVHTVHVSVARRQDALVVEVDDDGRGASTATTTGGFGIMGMRERVAAYDGVLVAGPRKGGGWRVRATFPVSTCP